MAYRKYRKYKKINCEICGVTDNDPVKIDIGSTYYGLSVHHLIPKNIGGNDEINNLITLCQKCHREKHTVNGKLNWHLVKEENANQARKTC